MSAVSAMLPLPTISGEDGSMRVRVGLWRLTRARRSIRAGCSPRAAGASASTASAQSTASAPPSRTRALWMAGAGRARGMLARHATASPTNGGKSMTRGPDDAHRLGRPRQTIDRRTFIETASGAALGLASLGHAAVKRKRFVIVGLGSRSRMFLGAITGPYRATSELVALVDTNPGRLALAGTTATAAGAAPRLYAASDFARALAEAKPDAVIV